MGRKAGQCNKTFTPYGIFIFTPSLEGWSTKAKEAPPLDIKLTPLDTNPIFQYLRVLQDYHLVSVKQNLVIEKIF